MSSPYAIVTLLTSDSYLPGALTVAGALKDLHPTPAIPPEVEFQLLCLVTPQTVDISTVRFLRRVFDHVIGVEAIGDLNEKNLQLLGRLDLTSVLTKLHVFRLTQYAKIIFLDADVLPIRPISHLLTIPHEFSAAPDIGWPDMFNSGVIVLTPGEEKFTQLIDLLKGRGTWDGGDQGILNEWRDGNWNRLSFIYNTTPTPAYTYAPAYERYGSNISVIHFIGPNKPWNSIPWRPPGVQLLQSEEALRASQAYNYVSLVNLWYEVYDRHYRSHTLDPDTKFQVKYPSIWNESRGTGPGMLASTDATAAHTRERTTILRNDRPIVLTAKPVLPKQPPELLPISSGTHIDVGKPASSQPEELSPHFQMISGSGALISTTIPHHQHVLDTGTRLRHRQSSALPHSSIRQGNTAIEPPPTLTLTKVFPPDTHLLNSWGQRYEGDFTESLPNNTFQYPSEILQHNRSDTGGSPENTYNSPDLSKVKPLFPWEHRPRNVPVRVFPGSGSLPGVFFPTSSPLAPGRHETCLQARIPPATKMQKRAPDLAQSPLPDASLGPPFCRSKNGYSNWEHGAEASSQEGDDEESDNERKNLYKQLSIERGSDSTTEKSERDSVSSIHIIKRGKKEYKMRAVQTLVPEMRSEAVQVMPARTNAVHSQETTRMGQGGKQLEIASF